ncbi:MAG: 5-bromo-4-chloroindolyl phosphate hydrolysis family protein [Clostridia bacterium]|nr:5-bromo-4-chloroindolyl phosphate hydrolysis family protein [Clostridia bacterium]
MSKEDKKLIKVPKNDGDGPSWIAIAATGIFQIYPVFAFLLFLKVRKLWQNHRLDKYRTYARAIGDSLAVSIKELAKVVGKPRSEVRDDLARMISKGYMGPEAYIDRSTDMLYLLRAAADGKKARSGGHMEFDLSGLSDIVSGISGIAGEVASTLKDAFKDTKHDAQYGHNYAPSGSKAEVYETGYADEEAQKAEYAASEPEEAPKTDAADIDSGRSESEATLAKLKKLNDDIADEEVSRKIDRIAMLTGDIYAFVSLNPERAGEVRKFMNYYLPTTMKLLTSYSLLEKQSYQGENIINARKDIEKILDTLVHAFEKQLDQLFATDAVDISSDIQVLETMMAKDGLSEEKKGYQLRI